MTRGGRPVRRAARAIPPWLLTASAAALALGAVLGQPDRSPTGGGPAGGPVPAPSASAVRHLAATAARLQFRTSALIAATGPGDPPAAARARTALRREVEDAERTLGAAPGETPARVPRPDATSWADAYIRAALAYARAGASSGDVRQLERAGDLLRLALSSLADGPPPPR